MKKSRKSDSQIMQILNQAQAGAPVSELCREHGMSAPLFSIQPSFEQVLHTRLLNESFYSYKSRYNFLHFAQLHSD